MFLFEKILFGSLGMRGYIWYILGGDQESQAESGGVRYALSKSIMSKFS